MQISRYRLTLVMMAGLPGAGKTTLAYALERELGWRVIDKDAYRIELLQQRLDVELAAKRAYDRSFAEIRAALLEERTSVIFDTAALHPFIIDEIMKIVRSVADVQLKVILCVVDRDIRDHRLRTRTVEHTRITIQPSSIIDYLRYFEHLPEERLTLYTNNPFEECLSRAKAYVIHLP